MAKKKVTQSKIAEVLGISRNTVSKALNNDNSVSEQLRRKIRNTAIEMGYTKLVVMDEKGGVYQQNIALVSIGNVLADSFWNTFVVGFEKRLRMLRYNLTLSIVDEEEAKMLVIPNNLSSSYVSGIVFIGICTKEFAEKLISLGIPTVFIDTFWDVDINNLYADTILVDNYHSVYKITEQLIQSGHKNIGFSGDIYTCRSYYERWLGYKQALLDYKLEYNENLCTIGQNIVGKYADGVALYEKFKKIQEKPTAMVCCNDGCAIQFMIHLKEDNYRIPEDIAVAGFDNIRESEYFYPSLTTVEGYRENLGKRAADQIVKRIAEPLEQFELIRLQSKPVFRDSTKLTLHKK